jgi:hypothetical protein
MSAAEVHDHPTVDELATLSNAELAERHDAQVARSRETGEPVSDVYLGELGRRMVELREERIIRIAFATFVVSGLALVVTIFVLALVV